MSEQRCTWYPDSETGPCYINHWPVERQLAPSWFRGNGQGGNVIAASYTWPDGERSEVYRDDLRKGWHVVPEGVRYVAVKGVKAGQKQRLYANESIALWCLAQYPETPATLHVKDEPDLWAVLDLHDLADHRKPTGAKRPADHVTIVIADDEGISPREVAKLAAERWGRVAEAARAIYSPPVHRAPEPDILPEIAKPPTKRPGIPNPTWQDLDCGEMGPDGDRCAHRYNHRGPCLWIVKGQHPDWQPPGPTDAEIVEAWDTAMREHEGGRPGPWSMSTEWNGRRLASVLIGPKEAPVRTTRDQYQAARSRELHRRQAEAREKERQRITCQGDWPGEGEFDA